VTRNREEVLRAFRDSKSPKSVWIDTLVINQSDTEERNAQVRMMADIFGGARHVVIYLLRLK
jgi:hypothetical protein